MMKIKLNPENPEVEHSSLLGRNKLSIPTQGRDPDPKASGLHYKLKENIKMIKKNINRIVRLPKRNFIFRTFKNISVSVFISIIILGQLFSPNVAQAASYTFSQTSWTSETANNKTHPDDGAWAQYSAKDAGITAGAEVTLTPNAYTATDDGTFSTTGSATGGGFASGTNTDTQVTGTGTGASVGLVTGNASMTKTSATDFTGTHSGTQTTGTGDTASVTLQTQTASTFTHTTDADFAGTHTNTETTGNSVQLVAGQTAGTYESPTVDLGTGGSLANLTTATISQTIPAGVTKNYAWGYNVAGQLGNGVTLPSNNPTPVQTNDLTDIVAIAAGTANSHHPFSHSLALKSDGTVWAWGYNGFGQLGDNSIVSKSSPVQTNGLTNVVAIAAGSNFSLALKSDQTVWAWGHNSSGQLGDGTSVQKNTPVLVSSLTDVVAIAAAGAYSLALKSDGTVWAWGNNYIGQLCDGTTTNRSIPVRITSLSNIVAITVGGNYNSYYHRDYTHALALKADGTVWAWGYNVYGQLGDDSIVQKTTPVPVKDLNGVDYLADVVAIEAGSFHSLALKADGTVWAWGANSKGQLGDSTILSKRTPVQTLGGLNDVIMVEAGGDYNGNSYSLALKSDGTVWAWGYNYYGQLGDGTIADKSIPTQVKDTSGTSYLTNITAISAGGDHSLAVAGGTHLRIAAKDTDSWVTGDYKPAPRQAGSSNRMVIANTLDSKRYLRYKTSLITTDINYTPTLNDITINLQNQGSFTSGAINLGGAKEFTGRSFSFATTIPAEIDGNRVQVQLSKDNTNWYGPNSSIGAKYDSSTCSVATGTYTCDYTSGTASILNDTSTLYYKVFLSSPNASYAPTFDSLTLNYHTTYNGTFESDTINLGGKANLTTATIAQTVPAGMTKNYAWGYNINGQLGNNSTTTSLIPIQTSGLTDVVAIASGDSYSLALKSDGTVWAWGYNNKGQLGNNSTTTSLIPIQTSGLTDVVAIAGGEDYSLVIKSDGTVWAWGYNNNGQLGNNSTTQSLIPIQTSGLTDVVAITGGLYHSLALKSDGTVWAWGYNINGQLGNNSTARSLIPIQTSGLTDVVAIASGDSHSLALKSDGTVWAWGSNYSGQLGNNSTTTSLIPIQTSGLTDVVAIAGGDDHSLAIKSNGTVWAWGYNGYGQLGNNSTTQSLIPIQTSGLTDVVAITGGLYHSLALKSDGTVWAWGYNINGQLGNNSTTQSLIPIQTSGLTDVVAIEGGAFHSLALRGGVSLQIATKDTDVGWDAGDYQTAFRQPGHANRFIIFNTLDGKQFLRYKTSLSTADAAYTPTLDNVTFNYTQYATTPQTLTSSKYNSTDAANTPASLQWTEELGTNTDLKFQIRTSADGNTWTNWCGPNDGVAGSCNSATYFTDPTGGETIDDLNSDQINDQWTQYQVTLTSDGAYTPTLSDVTLTYVVNAPPEVQTVTATQGTDGLVTVNYEVRDPDTTTGFTANTVAIGLQYCTANCSTPGGETWTDATSVTGDAGAGISVAEVSYTPYQIVWNPTTDYDGQFNATDFKVRVKANDSEIANNLGYGQSSTFTLDTTEPTLADTTLLINDSSSTFQSTTSAITLKLQNITGDTASEQIKVQFSRDGGTTWYGGNSDGTLTSADLWGTSFGLDVLVSKSWSWAMASRSETITARISDTYGNIQTITDTNSAGYNVAPEAQTVTASQGADGMVTVDYQIKDADTASGTVPNVLNITLQYCTSNCATTPVWADASTVTDDGEVAATDSFVSKSLSWNSKTDYVGQYNGADFKVRIKADDSESFTNLGYSESGIFVLDTANPTGTLVLNVDAGTATLSGTDGSAITYLLQNGSSVTSGTAAGAGSNAWTFDSEINKTVTALLSDPYGNQTSITAVTPAAPTSFQVRDLTNLPAGILGETLSWSAVSSTTGATTDHYEIWRQTGSEAFVLYDTTSGYTFSDTPVTNGIVYTYKVRTVDSDGDSSPFSSTQIITPSGVAISSVAFSSVTSSGATVTWNSDQFSNSVVQYGTTLSYGATQTGSDGNTNAHTVALTGLAHSTPYYFKVQSTDANGNTSTNDNGGEGFIFTTLVAYDITATAGENGTITPSGATSVQTGTDQTYTITPSAGYQIGTLTVDGSIVDNAGTYAFTNVTATHTIDVTFIANTFDITATAGENGTITPSGVTVVTSGTDQAYTITPEEGYTIASLVVDGVSLAQATTYTFTNVVATHTIDATFTNVPFPQVGFTSSLNQEEENVGVANIPVSISSTYPTNVTVDYAVTPGSALGGGVDYTLSSGNLTILAGETTANIVLVVTDDSIFEQTETLTVTLLNPTNATLGSNTLNTFSILDNDIAVSRADSAVKATSAIVTWTTASYTDSLVAYGTTDPGSDPENVTAGAYNLSKTNVNRVLDHSIYLGNLTPSTTYYVRTTSTDADSVATVATSTFTTTAGPVISGVSSSSVPATDTTATITWTTDLPATSYVNYSTDSGLASPARLGADTLETAHTVSLTGLSSGSTYYYSVDGTDADSNESEDANDGSYHTFITGTDQTPPIISEPTTPVVTSSQVAIVWDTNEDATSQVQYGTATGVYDQSTTLISVLLKSHLVAINGLTPETPYYYVVLSTDANGNSAISTEKTFDTGAAEVTTYGGGSMGVAQDIYDALLAQNKAYSAKFGTDTSIPVVSNIQVAGVTPFGATISFETSKDTIAFVDYGKETSYGFLTADSKWAKVHTIALSGLSLGTEYNFKITAMDLLNNLGYSENQTFTTKFLAENFADLKKVENIEQFQKEIESTIESILPSLIPPFIDTPTVTDITENSATINFRTNIKSYPIVNYVMDGVYDANKEDPYDGEVSDVSEKTIDHTIVLNNLKSNTKYHVMAKAFSLAQVVGESNDLTFTTAASKIQASVLGVKKDSFTVVWTTDEPTSSIVEYKDVRTGIINRMIDRASESSHSINITGLTPGTSYEVSVSGINANGNTIESGTPVTVRTSIDVTAPVISNLKVDSSLIIGLADKVQTIISWTTDEPSTSVVNYAESSGSAKTPLTNKQEKLEFTVNHVIILTSLKAGTVYRFNVESTDGAGNTVKPPIRTIVTPQQTASIMDIIFKNFDDTFKFINNI